MNYITIVQRYVVFILISTFTMASIVLVAHAMENRDDSLGVHSTAIEG